MRTSGSPSRRPSSADAFGVGAPSKELPRATPCRSRDSGGFDGRAARNLPDVGPVRAHAPVLARLESVGIRLATTPILAGVGIELDAGAAIGLIGPNGSGKTTLLRVLATLLPPHTGVGEVLGSRLGTGEVRAVRPRIVLVGHQPALHARLTLEENLALVARLVGVPSAGVRDVLDAVGLDAARARPARNCSHGMLRRADLARVLLTEPALLLLDEAHTGLDSASAELVEALVCEVVARDGSAVVVSHQPERLAGIVDRFVTLEAGRVADDRRVS